MIPFIIAYTHSPETLFMPSLADMFFLCESTVLTLIFKLSAISLLVNPCATSFNTSISLADRPVCAELLCSMSFKMAATDSQSGTGSVSDASTLALSSSSASQASSGGFRYVAVGEIGMDLYWDKTYARQQEDSFRIQLEWAKSLDLPVVLHVRNAFEEAWHVLSKAQDGRLKGVFHCYSGSLEQSRRVLDLGFLFGIGGVLTFKNAKLPEIVRQLPLESLLLETDAPYLAPVPYRGKPNEGAYIPLIGRKLAECLDLPVSTVAEATTANALRLFRLS